MLNLATVQEGKVRLEEMRGDFCGQRHVRNGTRSLGKGSASADIQ